MSSTLASWFKNAAPEPYLDRRCLLEVAGRVEAHTGLDNNLLLITGKGEPGGRKGWIKTVSQGSEGNDVLVAH